MLKLRKQRQEVLDWKVPSQPNFSRSEVAFSYVGPKFWNDLLQATDTITITHNIIRETILLA